MLLISPPLYKACEPPPALAYLAGTLKSHGVDCTVCDMNREAQLWLLQQPLETTDTWTRRARNNLERNLIAIADPALYRNIDRYRRTVADINRIIAQAGLARGLQLSLANLQHQQLSPVRSTDLLQAATDFAATPFHTFFAPRLEELLEASAATTVGLSLNFLSQALCAFAMIGYLKHHHPQLRLMVGGGLVTSWMSNPDWHNPFSGLLDEMVSGPGEEVLLDHYHRSRQTPHCLPDFDSLADKKYFAPGFILPYAASFGCLWRKCSFCPERSEQNIYRPLEPGLTVTQLHDLVDRYGPRLIHLIDNSISPAVLASLAQQPPGAPWYGFTRITRQLADPDFCLALRKSGCLMLKIGLESGDQKVLDQLHKGVDLQLAKKVFANLQTAGIATYVYLLFGTPPEDARAAERTLDFVERHQEQISFLNLAIFNLPINSPDASHLTVKRFSDADLSLYSDFTHPLGWDRKAIRHFLAARFRRSPGVRAILAKDPPFFTSNHAPLLSLYSHLDLPSPLSPAITGSGYG